MILPSTQISLEPHGVSFVNHTSHGIQLIRVTMTLREPTILPMCVTLENNRPFFHPLSLTEKEATDFFRRADEEWLKTRKMS